MPSARPPQRPLSALWIGALAAVGAWGALGGDPTPSTPAVTRLMLAPQFVPDESSLPTGPVDAPSAMAPQFAPRFAVMLAPTDVADPEIRWNGHGDQRWTLPDGRVFVVSAWGATWWLRPNGQRLRTALDLPGYDPARPGRIAVDPATTTLSLQRSDGGPIVVDLSGRHPVLRSSARSPA